MTKTKEQEPARRIYRMKLEQIELIGDLLSKLRMKDDDTHEINPARGIPFRNGMITAIGVDGFHYAMNSRQVEAWQAGANWGCAYQWSTYRELGTVDLATVTGAIVQEIAMSIALAKSRNPKNAGKPGDPKTREFRKGVDEMAGEGPDGTLVELSRELVEAEKELRIR